MKKVYSNQNWAYKFFGTLILIGAIMLLSASSSVAQIALGSWVQINKGFSKCPTSVGTSAGEAAWDVDGFEVTQFLARRKLMYAVISYNGNTGANGVYIPLNPASCGQGLYAFDTIVEKWKLVANDLDGSYGDFKLVSNGNDIIRFQGGNVYVYDNNYALYPTGWRQVNVAPYKPMTYSQLSAGTQSSCYWDNPGNEGFRFSSSHTAEAIGDTVFYLFPPGNGTGSDLPACYARYRIGKFNINSGTWTFVDLPEAPLPTSHHGPNWFITDKIAGLFQYFIFYKYEGNLKSIPDFYWVYDPRVNQWVNISKGPNYQNLTGSANPADIDSGYVVNEAVPDGNGDPSVVYFNNSNPMDFVYTPTTGYSRKVVPTYTGATNAAKPTGFPNGLAEGGTFNYNGYNNGTQNPYNSPNSWVPYINRADPINKWGPVTMYESDNRKSIYMGTEQGIYRWNGGGYDFIKSGNAPIYTIFDDTRILYTSGNYYNNSTTVNLNSTDYDPSGWQVYTCNTAFVGSNRLVASSDEGKTFYASMGTRYEPPTCATTPSYNQRIQPGIFRYRHDFSAPASVTNIHLSTGTYIGGAGNNNSVGVGISGRNRIYVCGNYDALDLSKNKTRAYDVSGNPTGIVLDDETDFTDYAGARPDHHPQRYFRSGTVVSKARIIGYTGFADSIYSITYLGTSASHTVQDYDIQNLNNITGETGPRGVAIGDFGVVCVDSMGRILWSKTVADFPGASAGTLLRVDISSNGHVACLRYNSTNSHSIWVYDENGNAILAGTIGIGNTYAYDIAINWNSTSARDEVAIVGFDQSTANNYSDNCAITPICKVTMPYPGCQSGNPVQIAYVRHFDVDPATNSFVEVPARRTYGFNMDGSGVNSLVGSDMADTRGYRINYGQDGKLYYLGESAGGNTIYRWDGKHTESEGPPSGAAAWGCTPNIEDYRRQIDFDNYNQTWNAASAHFAWVATINPSTGEIERGMFIVPRTSDNMTNTFRVQDGSVFADIDGFVYVCGQSAYKFQGRETQTVNGNIVGDYNGGDMNLLIIRPDYKARTFWGTPSKTLGAGKMVGIAQRNGNAVILGNVETGEMVTGGSANGEFSDAYALIPNANQPNKDMTKTISNTDSWLGVFYRDVWNHSGSDTIDVPTIPGDTIIDPIKFTYKMDFEASKTTVCINQGVVFSNTSVGDSSGTHKWYFGDNASLPDGMPGEGPHVVSYSVKGLKSVKLTGYIKVGPPHVEDEEYKFEYVNVLDPATTPLGTISGPKTVCEGSVVVYSVDPDVAFGIDSMVWTVPTGATILQGQGTPTVKVLMGNSNTPNISVTGYCTMCNGIPTPTSSLSPALTVNSSSVTKILYVVADDAALTAGETAIKTKLDAKATAMSGSVELLDDDDITPEKASCVSLVVISPAAVASKVGFNFVDATNPVIVANPGLYDEMGMTFGTTVNQGVQVGTQIDVQNVNHQLRISNATVATGAQTVYSASNDLNYGNPSTSAIKVATIVGNTDRAVIFAYEQGATMRSGTAAGRRVGFYTSNAGAAALSGVSNDLFDNLLCWVLYNCATTNTIDNVTATAGPYCPGQTIGVSFDATGTYNAGNSFKVQLSNSFGSFAAPTTIATYAYAGTPVSTLNIPSVTIPSTIPAGNNYKIRVVSTDPSLIGDETNDVIIINSTPAAPTSFTASMGGVLCAGQPKLEYYGVTKEAGLTYVWDLPQGSIKKREFDSTDGKNYVYVDFYNLTGNRSVKVYSQNTCGQSISFAERMINLSATEPDAPGTVGGPSLACAAMSDQNFSVTPGNLVYKWQYKVNGDPNNDAGYTDLTKTAGSDYLLTINPDGTGTNPIPGLLTGDNLHIRVAYQNNCGQSPWTVKTVPVNNAPAITVGDISGTLPFCGGQSATLSVPINTDAAYYTWTTSEGGHTFTPNGPSGGLTGAVTNITFTSAGGVGNISVTATHTCGSVSTPKTLAYNMPAGAAKALIVIGNLADTTYAARPVNIWLRKHLMSTGNFTGVDWYATDANNANENCYKLIVIAPGASPTTASHFADAAVPLINMRGAAIDDLNMCKSGRCSDLRNGNLDDTRGWKIRDLIHPVRGSLPSGVMYPYSTYAANNPWNGVAAGEGLTGRADSLGLDAVKLGNFGDIGAANNASDWLFAFEAGSRLYTGTAPARRLNFGVLCEFDGVNGKKYSDTAYFKSNLLQLFENAVCWSLNNCDDPLMLVDASSVDALSCPKQAKTITAQINGGFNPGNKFVLQMVGRSQKAFTDAESVDSDVFDVPSERIFNLDTVDASGTYNFDNINFDVVFPAGCTTCGLPNTNNNADTTYSTIYVTNQQMGPEDACTPNVDFGVAAKFDGVDDYLRVNGWKGITDTGSGGSGAARFAKYYGKTVEAWIRVPRGSSEMPIITWGANKTDATVQTDIYGSNAPAANNGTGSFVLYISKDGTLSFRESSHTNLSFEPTATSSIVNDGEWHHVAISYFGRTGNDQNEHANSGDGNHATGSDSEVRDKIDLYVDGTWVGAGNISKTSAAAYTGVGEDVTLGAWRPGTADAWFFKGEMDEVRIFETALEGASGDPIALRWKNELAGNEASLVAYYNFNDYTANDKRSNTTSNKPLRNASAIGGVTYTDDAYVCKAFKGVVNTQSNRWFDFYYFFRVVSTDPAIEGTLTGAKTQFGATVESPSSIVGETDVCPYSLQTYTYPISPLLQNSKYYSNKGYTIEVPDGATIVEQEESPYAYNGYATVKFGETSGNIRITATSSGCSAPTSAELFVNINPSNINTWTGDVDSNWFNPNNWTCGIPTDSSTVIIPSTPSGNRMPVISTRVNNSPIAAVTPAVVAAPGNIGSVRIVLDNYKTSAIINQEAKEVYYKDNNDKPTFAVETMNLGSPSSYSWWARTYYSSFGTSTGTNSTFSPNNWMSAAGADTLPMYVNVGKGSTAPSCVTSTVNSGNYVHRITTLTNFAATPYKVNELTLRVNGVNVTNTTGSTIDIYEDEVVKVEAVTNWGDNYSSVQNFYWTVNGTKVKTSLTGWTTFDNLFTISRTFEDGDQLRFSAYINGAQVLSQPITFNIVPHKTLNPLTITWSYDASVTAPQVCASGSSTIELIANNPNLGISPIYRWYKSTDGGSTWEWLPNAKGARVSVSAAVGDRFRVEARPDFRAESYCRHLIIESGAKVIHRDGNMYVAGDIEFEGSNGMSTEIDAPVVFEGIETQTISGSSMPTFNKMIVANTSDSGVVVGTDVFISDSLNFVKGMVYIDGSSVTLNPGAKVFGNNATDRFIVTGGNYLSGGRLIRTATAAETAFPIGSDYGKYNPVYLTSPTAGDEKFQARVYEGVVDFANSYAPLTTDLVQKTWRVAPTDGSATNITMKVQWNGSDEPASFDRNSANVKFYKSDAAVGSPWINTQSPTVLATMTAVAGAGPYTVQGTGINSFSDWIVGDDFNPLSLDLLWFSAVNHEGNAKLDWTSAGNGQIKMYVAEKSTDRQNFVAIGSVSANELDGRRDQYTFTDYKLTNDAYYRIKAILYDGTEQLTSAKLVTVKRTEGNFVVYPNPARNTVWLAYTGTTDPGNICIRVVDLAGRVVDNIEGSLSQVNAELNRKVEDYNSGVYNITIVRQNTLQVIKLVKE